MKPNHYAYFIIFFILSVLLKNVACDGSSPPNKNGKRSFKISVMLPTHYSTRNNNSLKLLCSDKFIPDALQNVEALYFALDLIEKDHTLSQNFSLIIDIIETCSLQKLEMQYFSNLLEQLQEPLDAENATVGLIYDDYLTELDYENVFKSFPYFPHVSSQPRQKFDDVNLIKPKCCSDYVTTTSGLIFITDVMFEILNHFEWKYIIIVYSYLLNDRVYGLAKSDHVCIQHIINPYNPETVPTATSTNEMADVIICDCSEYNIKQLKQLLQKYDKKFVVIAGHYEYQPPENVNWTSDLGDLYYITRKPQYDEKFYNYYASLSVKNNTRHRYLEEFRKQYFMAQFPSKNWSEETPSDTYRNTYGYMNDSNTAIDMIKSLYIMAHLLKKTLNESLNFTSRFELRNLRDIKFELFNEEVSFDQYTGLPNTEKFDIHKFQATPNKSGNFVKVGEYLKIGFERTESITRIRGNLTIMNAEFPYSKDYPKQTCSKPCPKGRSQMRKQDNQCCWDCVLCDYTEKVNSNTTSCEKCEDGTVANQNKNDCVPINSILQLPTNWTDGQNLISIGFSSFSIILTAIVLYVFVKYQNTPAVKSTTKELCYVMFAGIILVNFTLFISAVTSSFGTSDVKVLPAIGFTMIYAALLVKTNRIARLLVTSEHRFANINPKYMSLTAQLIITSILIGIEVVICSYAVKFHYLESNMAGSEFILREHYFDGMFFIQIFTFVAILILLCTYYAIKTRNLPQNFNETKCIGFAMYATLLTAVAFSLVYFATEKKILAMNLCASINSLTILTFLFSPKLYIILWTPEKNTRVYFSPVTSNIRSYIGNEMRHNSSKPLNQCHSLENLGSRSNFNNAAEGLEEQTRDPIAKAFKELNNILDKELNPETLKEKLEKGDLGGDEMDSLQKACSEMAEKIQLRSVELNRLQEQ